MFNNIRKIKYSRKDKIFKFRKKSKYLRSNHKRTLGYGIYVKLIETNQDPAFDDLWNSGVWRLLCQPNIFGKLYNWFYRIYLIYWGDLAIPYNENHEYELISHNINYKIYSPKGDKLQQIIFQNNSMVEFKLIFEDNIENYFFKYQTKEYKKYWFKKGSIIRKVL